MLRSRPDTLNRGQRFRLLREEGERIRDVVQGPVGALYLVTDEGRGRVLKLVPKKS